MPLCCFRKYGKKVKWVFYVSIVLRVYNMCVCVCVRLSVYAALYLISLSKRYIDISHSIMTFDLCFFLFFFCEKKVGKMNRFVVHFKSDIEFICNVQ